MTFLISLALVSVLVVSLIAPFVSSCESPAPGEADVYASYAMEAFDKGDYSGALSYWNQSIQLDSDNAYFYLGRGMTYFVLGDMTKAIEDLNRSIVLDPGFAYAYYFRGMVYRLLGETEQAIVDFLMCLALNPDEETRQVVEGYLKELEVTP